KQTVKGRERDQSQTGSNQIEFHAIHEALAFVQPRQILSTRTERRVPPAIHRSTRRDLLSTSSLPRAGITCAHCLRPSGFGSKSSRARGRWFMASHKRQNVSFPNNPQLFFLYVSAELNRAHEAGAVQQDIKAGNVLLIENCLEPERLVGFVIDCDYAALSEEALRVLRDVVKPRPHRHFFRIRTRRTKGSTGTPSFMALAMLQKNPTAKHALGHDLESLYWLLIWLCLRHTEHRLGPRRFSGLFNTVCLFLMKSSSLFREEDYAPSGFPLWSLTSDFQDLVMAQNLSGKPPTALKPPFDLDRDTSCIQMCSLSSIKPLLSKPGPWVAAPPRASCRTMETRGRNLT
ncbi:unnamed protein product, partial [Mycena citricolor]